VPRGSGVLLVAWHPHAPEPHFLVDNAIADVTSGGSG